ncbi:MAG: hypothetical protein KAR06_08010 [Deltaproteobacteria bacterium]|nr:hypothetical protein [Deltaproteobacteria bacterium]
MSPEKPMGYEHWAMEKLREQGRCKVEEGMACIPLREDQTCQACYGDYVSELEPRPTDKYKHMNHHHKLTPEQEIVDLGTGPFVADKPMLPLLRALNAIGLRTRSHNYNDETGEHFICLCLDKGLTVEIKNGVERKSTREDMCTNQIVIGWKEADNE